MDSQENAIALTLVVRGLERLFALAIAVVLLLCAVALGAGCTSLNSMGLEAGDGIGGAGGQGSADAITAAGGRGGGHAGGGGAGGANNFGFGGSPVCVENTRSTCRDSGTALLSAQYVCRDDGYNETVWDPCGSDGKLTGYYAGLSCPFDVGIVNSVDWKGPCPECTDGKIVVDGGGSTAAVWRNTPDMIYCCDGNTVRKIARCAP